MPPSENPPLDIEVLMERIRSEVARRRTLTTLKPASASGPYLPGTLVRFGLEGNAGPFLASGWSQAEPGFHWTDGDVAEMVFTLEPAPGDLVLTFTAHPMVGGGVDAQEVTASWNGVPVGEWSLREGKTCHGLILSSGLGRPASATLRFHLPRAFSPASRNLGGDPRRLGLAFHELVLRPAAELGF